MLVQMDTLVQWRGVTSSQLGQEMEMMLKRGLLLQAWALAGIVCVWPSASRWEPEAGPAGLVQTDSGVSVSEGLGWTPRITFLASSPVVLPLMGVWAPLLENHGEADRETCCCQPCNGPMSLKAGRWD